MGAEIGVAVGSDGCSDVASKVGFDDVGSEVRRCLVRSPMFLAPKSDVGSEVSADDVGSEVVSDVDSDVGSEVRRCLKSPMLAPTSDVGSEVSTDDVGSEVRRWIRSER